ncbi:MAG: RNA polymerase subunit sigma-70 [Acidobacteriota bacterium]|nr:RNA polymerase subunit sigma-70 [Acidobacteriota bacterium]
MYGTAERVARRSYGKLVAFLAARTGDVAGAEDALSEAFTSALADWPLNGTPLNPEAWLLTAARRKMIDQARRQRFVRNPEDSDEHTRLIEGGTSATLSAVTDELATDIPDRRLALMFACAHPAIDTHIRAPLMLQTVLGLDAARIASAFLMSPAAMGQRLVRAKNKIRDAGIPFRVPERKELGERLGTVLDAIYAAFAEGWIDAAGTDLSRRELAGEAIYLGRLVTDLLPHEPEALGLLALMLHAEARRLARRNNSGDFIPLAEQNTALWDAGMINQAEALLSRASGLVLNVDQSAILRSIGRYQLEGAVQSAHVTRRRTGVDNWAAVVQLYNALWQLLHSPVIAINRALAIAEVEGAGAALNVLDLIVDPRVAEYQPYWAARAELLARTGSKKEARQAYDRAIGLEQDDSVRRFLQRRQADLGTDKLESV